jgi:PAS domain S-box-containing protein
VSSDPAAAAALHLAAIVEWSDDAIVSKDLNGTILSWNRGATRIFGYTESEAIGRPIRMLIPDERQQEEDEVLARIRAGKVVDHFETVRVRKDGSRIDISLTVSPIRATDGTIVGASKIARDITDRKRIESALTAAEADRARALEEAQQANRLKDDFLATLSHELRTPLNAILGYARMLRARTIAADRREAALETVERNARSLAQIVDDLLDISRVVAGKLAMHVRPVVLSRLVDEAVATVLPAAQAKGVNIFARVAPDVQTIVADPDRMQQVLWNLLSNAVKFTSRGGRIAVEARRTEGEIEVVVTDNGDGIPREFLPYVFDRFRQADSRIPGVRRGLGIGLAIVRHIVEMHGGTIEAESDGVGKGAVFRVRLPAVMTESEPMESVAS